jgi:HD superfamily phosphohydrolase
MITKTQDLLRTKFASSVVLIRYFGSAVHSYDKDIDLILLARMITGIEYSDKKRSFENCFIRLLNGCPLDIDKLDYILRDSWACGL